METDSAAELSALSIKDVLDADSRPTFVIDLDPDEDSHDGAGGILPVFCNSALRLHEKLSDALVGPEAQGFPPGEKGQPTYEAFKSWATGVTPHDDSKDVFPLAFLYGDLLWTGSTVRRRWRLISGNRTWRDAGPVHDLSSGVPQEMATGGVLVEETSRKTAEATKQSPEAPPVMSSRDGTATLVSSKAPKRPKSFFHPSTTGGSSDERSSSQSGSITLSSPDKAVSDWTAAHPKGVLSAHIQHARSIDWAQTPLGPMESWSPELRQTANLCMCNPHPAALFWGNELTVLYNEAYATEVAGNKHPDMMGTGYSGMFSEIWDYAGPIFVECARTGMSVRKENDYLPIYRNGLLEETFFSWSFTPLYGGTERIVGFYNAPFETTEQVINQRRMKTINKIGEHTAHAKTVKQFWRLVLESFDDNHLDLPFALLYSVGEGEDNHSSISSGSSISLKTCHLEGSIGVPDGHIAAPIQLDLKRSQEGFVPSFREAMRTREPILLGTRDGTLPEALLIGIEWRGFGDPCRQATVFPVRPTNGDAVLAFLVLGVNPRRHYDDEYRAFTSMLNRQLATSLASVLLYEEEVRRNRDAAEAAALEKEHLTQQLDLQASRLRRMTELSPLGMFLISPEGILREGNDRFFEMTGHPRDFSSQYEMSWMDSVMESSLKTMKDGWHRLIHEHLPWSGELELKKRSTSPVNLHGESIDYWVMFSAHSEFAVDGSLRSIMGSITDISHLKWAQGLQTRQLQEAEETRRQQNEFIDITSHEMRNPLSAILQCADDISTSLAVYNNTPPPQEVVESCVTAAQTITLCVQHQKSIVDDILTISKLDSNLLVITPAMAQPEAILSRAVKMFEPELQAKGIELVFEKYSSYTELAIDWVAVDPNRVLQILINLMTNAIKFTAASEERKITVHVGASLTPPDGKDIAAFQYVPPSTSNPNIAYAEEWATGESLYVRFEVQDTGCGLTQEEKQILFQRFKQASPRTHAQYGGSGLGLFISKRLAELHGGQIGVASHSGQGSLFGFYVQAKRLSPVDRNPQGAVPAERTSLTFQVTPQRQDFASSGPAASLLATKADPLLNLSETYVLVVEDNLINQTVLVKQLKKAGCRVSAANDGIEALAFLQQTHFLKEGGDSLSIILMDLEMPNMDGLTCMREIRRMEEDGRIAKHVPVIAVTANVRDEQVTAAKLSGMDDVVSKPFRISDLLMKIETLLGRL